MKKENKRLKNEIISLTDNIELLKMKANTPTKTGAANKTTANQLVNNEFENRYIEQVKSKKKINNFNHVNNKFNFKTDGPKFSEKNTKSK